jgi:hypothetical protein
MKAAQTIWDRFTFAVGGNATQLVPADVQAMQVPRLREVCGAVDIEAHTDKRQL